MCKKDENGLTEQEFLAAYKPGDYDRPSVTVDIMVIRMKEDLSCMQILLIKRKAHPEICKWALPGGFINIDESAYEAACRELKEETSLTGVYLEQLYTMSKPDRDPRMRIIDISYIALLPYGYEQTAVAGDDAKDARWFDIDLSDGILKFSDNTVEIKYSLKSEKFKNGIITVENFVPVSISSEALAFDHGQIVLEGLMRIKNKAEYTGIVYNLVPPEFTIPDLQQVYEVLIGKPVYPKAFRDKISDDIIPLNKTEKPITGRRVASVYRYINLDTSRTKPKKTKEKKYENGVILTRAQPFHNGHLSMVKQAAAECKNVLVVIGSANKNGTKRNPFPIEYRKNIVEKILQAEELYGTNVQVISLSDWSMENAAEYVKEWGTFFYCNVVNAIGKKSFVFYYNDNPDIAKNWFNKDILKHVFIKSSGRTDVDISSTMVREMLLHEEYDKFKKAVPREMWGDFKTLRKMLLEADDEDFMMK